MKAQSYNLAMILVDAFWVINLGFNAPTAMINFVIIGKELSYELNPFRKYFYGGSKEDLVLGFGWMWHQFWHVINYFNPLWWIYSMFVGAGDEKDELVDYRQMLSEDDV
jgi:hypothetical protein